jgi:hypothetical protein
MMGGILHTLDPACRHMDRIVERDPASRGLDPVSGEAEHNVYLQLSSYDV